MSAPILLIALLTAAVSLVALYALGRWFTRARPQAGFLAWLLVALRLTVLGLVVLATVNPAFRMPATVPTPPHLTLLLDASASMGLPDTDGRTRWQSMQAMLARPDVAAALRRFQVRRQACARGLLPRAPAAPTDSLTTDLALALEQLATDPRPQHVLLVSDGVVTTGDVLAAAERLAARGVTVHAVGVGPLTPPPDAALTRLQVPRVVREHEPFTLSAGVHATGLTGRGKLTITCDGRVVGQCTVPLGQAADAGPSLRLAGLPAGVHLLTAALTVPGPEATPTNNQRSVFVEARRDRDRVLLVAGAPSLEYACLRRVLLELPRGELTSWVRLAPGRFACQTDAGYAHRTFAWSTALRRQQVVLLADLEAAALDAAALARYVREGGNLAILGGPRTLGRDYARSPLAALLAMAPGGDYQPVPVGVAPPTIQGALGRELVGALGRGPWSLAPYLAGANIVNEVNPEAERVLNTRGGRPLLAVRGAGLGRCAVLATDGTHRWVVSPEADRTSRDLHRRFWQQLVSWLAAPREESQVRLLVDPPVAAPGQPLRALVRVQQALQAVTRARVTVRVRGPQTALNLVATPTATPGGYQAALPPLSPGKYEVQASATTARLLGRDQQALVIVPGGPEMAELTRREGLLRQVAARGHGEYASLERLPELLQRLDSRPQAQATRVVSHPARSWLAFALLLALLTVDWWLRRRQGW